MILCYSWLKALKKSKKKKKKIIYFSIYKNDIYHQKHKERLRKEARERYQNLSEEQKEKIHNKNLSEEQKQKLIEYRRNYYLMYNK